jgi:hypothetical protein
VKPLQKPQGSYRQDGYVSLAVVELLYVIVDLDVGDIARFVDSFF